MTTYALAPTDVPDRDDVTAMRLIASFPLSGQPGTGYDIHVQENSRAEDGIACYWIVDRTHNARILPRHFGHYHEAIRHALRDLGWGEYTITPPEGINW